MGRSHVHWLTGTASTVMVGSVEGILGMRPDLEGLRISPSIPPEWDGLEITKKFRGKQLHITVENPRHQQSGYTRMTLNGKELPDNYIPAELLTENNEILLVMYTNEEIPDSFPSSPFSGGNRPFRCAGKALASERVLTFQGGCLTQPP